MTSCSSVYFQRVGFNEADLYEKIGSCLQKAVSCWMGRKVFVRKDGSAFVFTAANKPKACFSLAHKAITIILFPLSIPTIIAAKIFLKLSKSYKDLSNRYHENLSRQQSSPRQSSVSHDSPPAPYTHKINIKEHIENLPEDLERLSLANAFVNGDNIASLKRLKNLKVLDLSCCREIDFDALSSLSPSEEPSPITHLNLSACNGLLPQEDDLERLLLVFPKRYPHLQEVNLSGLRIPTQRIHELIEQHKGKYPALTRINFIV